VAHLDIRLLGSFQVTADGEAITEFESDKVRALLAYLSVESDQPIQREFLAEMLWPDRPEGSARSNLRHALVCLRRAIGDYRAEPPYLLISRQTVQFNCASDIWVDVADLIAFEMIDINCAEDILRLEELSKLLRGDFLEGLSLIDSVAFEEWVLLEREHFRRHALNILHYLSDYYEMRGDYDRALTFAKRQVVLEPWYEEAHSQLMRLLALNGQRSAALAQYKTCRRLLSQELSVEPTADTVQLYERIRDNRLDIYVFPHAHTPAYLHESKTVMGERIVFVARERQIEKLDAHLNRAVKGESQFVFVTGGAGEGKTALVQGFARFAQERFGELIVVSGNCTAYTGIGDPYLPFREILEMLAGNVEDKWRAGSLTSEHALRLWDLLPVTASALNEDGPDLINSFVSGTALISRLAICSHHLPSWLHQLRELVIMKRVGQGRQDFQKKDLFEQYTNVLRRLSQQTSLLLILDDLQWADMGSLYLLFHLGRQLDKERIMILCAYRPEELELGRDGERHPLEKVLAEFKRQFGNIWIDLNKVEDIERGDFVNAFLDTEPNRLAASFRKDLTRHTDGNPLFTIELLKDMQERGDLMKDTQERWTAKTEFKIKELPSKIEGVIEERISRLGNELRQALIIASVEGERFFAQAISQVMCVDEGEILRCLSEELEKRHHLIREIGQRQVGSHSLSHFRFNHSMFQHFLYNAISAGERRLLHGKIASALEELYKGYTEEIDVYLARHFTEAENGKKAIPYLLHSGDRARASYAHEEAIDHYIHALAFLKERGDYYLAACTLIKIGLTYHTAFEFQKARQSFQEGFALWQRAGEVETYVPFLPAPHALKMNWEQLSTLDPTISFDVSDSMLWQLFNGLVDDSQELDVIPAVAKSWDVSNGGCTYIFQLRDDVCWTDELPVTAYDFEYSMKRVLSPEVESPLASFLYDIKGAKEFHLGEVKDPTLIGVQASDNTTLVVELEKPSSYFLQLLINFPAVPRHVVERYGDAWTEPGNIITTGPFRLDSWNPGKSMTLERNQKYFGQFRGNLQKVELCMLTDPNILLEMYENDELDILDMHSFPTALLDCASHRYAGEYLSFPWLTTMYLGFNTSRPPFNDIRVRQAFAYSIDVVKLTDEVLRGYEFPASGGFVPPDMPGHSPDIGCQYNPELARQLLGEAGYPDGRGFPPVDLFVRGGFIEQGKYLQAQWRANLNTELQLSFSDCKSVYYRMGKEFHNMFIIYWCADYPDPDSFLRTSPIRQLTQWQDEAYSGLIEEASWVFDQAKRLDIYKQVDKILIEGVSIVPLYYLRKHFLLKPWVKNFSTSVVKWALWKDIIIEPH